MHPKLQEALERKITELVSHLTAFQYSKPTDHPFRHLHFQGHSFGYGHEENIQITELISYIRKKSPSGRSICEAFIRKNLFELFRELLATDDTSHRASKIDQYFKLLEGSVEKQIVLIPIFGLEMKVDSWVIGRIRIQPIEHDTVQMLSQNLANLIHVGMIPVSLITGVYAIFEVEAEGGRAKELAREETRRAIDFIRFAAALEDDGIYARRIIALEDEFNFQPDNRHVCVFPKDGKKFDMHWRADDKVLPLQPLTVTRDFVERLETGYFGKVSPLLKKNYDEVNTFERALIRSLHWFANYQVQSEVENKLLSLITAMETLFTKDDGTPISTSIAEGVAFIAANNVTERIAVKDLMKKMYDSRSKVSHGGEIVIEPAVLSELLPICRKVILWMIDRLSEFKDFTDLTKWTEEQKFAAPSSEH